MRCKWLQETETLRVHSPAKINLYLEVLGWRPDGFHEIDTLMQAVSLEDTLEFRRAPKGSFSLDVVDAPQGARPPADHTNLVLRAVDALIEELRRQRRSDCVTGLSITLRKQIPMGGGLGGGSSNAAATLIALNHLWKVALEGETLWRLAASLGSDVPFFLSGGLARCRGRGEIVTPITESNAAETFYYVLVTPPFEVPSALIYNKLADSLADGNRLTTPKPLATMSLKAVLRELGEVFSGQKQLFMNRLQEVAFKSFPDLYQLYIALSEEPFELVQMTGSGSTLFGLCPTRQRAEELAERVRQRLEPEKQLLRIFVVSSLPTWSRTEFDFLTASGDGDSVVEGGD